MSVILYSTKCPRCIILDKKLKEKNITYTEVNDVGVMTEKGFTTVPMLEVDGTVMDYKTAFNYVESL